MPNILHGDTTPKLIFSLSNPYNQANGQSQGICTAASLAWCKACLKLGRGVNSWAEVGLDVHLLNIQMATMRKLDSEPRRQTELAGLVPVGPDKTLADLDTLFRETKNTAPYICIFWTSGHTMGYRYSHHEKEFFDMEQGLFRAKYTDGIKNEINKNYQNQVIGMRLVKLP